MTVVLHDDQTNRRYSEMTDPDRIDEATLRDMQSGDYILHERDGRGFASHVSMVPAQ